MCGQGKATFRRGLLAALAAVLGCSLAVDVVSADGMMLPETLGIGFLGVRYHRVQVTIKDNHAVTQVEQEFYNPYDFEIDGRYLFPVPPEAMLSDFQAVVDGKAQQVVRQDTAATNAALHAAVTNQEDPSLLRYMDWESLAFDLTLGPGESCRMVLEYEEILAAAGGMYLYRYILSTERYAYRPVEEVSLTVDINSSAGLASVYSPSHAVTVEHPEEGHARASWKAEHTNPAEDFELYFAPAQGGFGSGLLTGQHDGEGYFLFLFSPDAESARDDTLPKDIVFVIDRSGSMSGKKIEQARNALHFVLGQLGEEDRFSIVSFNDGLRTLSQKLLPVGRDTLADARRFVDGLTADGSTDLEVALQTGLRIISRSEQREVAQLVVFLTDGLPTAGITDDVLIAESIAQANAETEYRLHVFGVGYDVNTHLLDRLAADNGGTVTYVQPGENLEAVLTGFYGQIAHPVLTDVEIEYEGMTVSELHPEALPDLFHGSNLLLAGRYQAWSDVVKVRVRGQAGAEARVYAYEFDLGQTGDRDFVPRLWATRELGILLDQVRVEGENEALVGKIKNLGLEFGLVTPYTLFVIEGQAEGAASAANMGLYENQAELNQAWGRTTIQARVQNQAYQDASGAYLAKGGNVTAYNGSAAAQFSADPSDRAQARGLSVDLSLLQGQDASTGPITIEWIDDHVGIDRTVIFGSEEYFALAEDPAARSFMQAGVNTVFAQRDEVILIKSSEESTDSSGAVETSDNPRTGTRDNPRRQQIAPVETLRQSADPGESPDARPALSAKLLLAVVGTMLAGVGIILKVWEVRQ